MNNYTGFIKYFILLSIFPNLFMKKYLLAVTSLMMMSVMYFEAQLQIVPRYDAGTLQKDVERVQTYLESDGHTVPVWKLNQIKYQANMKAMRMHYDCVKTPAQCGNQAWQPK